MARLSWKRFVQNNTATISQLANLALFINVINAGNWWLSQISWFTNAAKHEISLTGGKKILFSRWKSLKSWNLTEIFSQDTTEKLYKNQNHVKSIKLVWKTWPNNRKILKIDMLVLLFVSILTTSWDLT